MQRDSCVTAGYTPFAAIIHRANTFTRVTTRDVSLFIRYSRALHIYHDAIARPCVLPHGFLHGMYFIDVNFFLLRNEVL